MINAKKELLELLDLIDSEAPTKPSIEIKCASILYSKYDEDTEKKIVLKYNYSATDLIKFIEELDFEYDGGYGVQYLYGTVWFKDGTWLERYEYDGSECWIYRLCPDIPEECL